MAHSNYQWLDVQRIAEELADRHPSIDPYTLRFTELRALVEALPGFEADPKHPVNEKILETIQANWAEERDDLRSDDDD
ncbi:MAG: Fe-S cluster assembly protein IscX [Phycisphaeraceae bacterium]|nr:Fe-S cluster assembly protein IscX [Phycisphaeraceae bacterium]MCW5768261.1 Fe-S cluster assembly protein IscX [Phycisphaeraceae bacterium]